MCSQVTGTSVQNNVLNSSIYSHVIAVMPYYELMHFGILTMISTLFFDNNLSKYIIQF